MTHPSPDDVAARHDALRDEELLAAVRAGDTGAYAALYRRHLGPALSQARRLVGSHEGQDVAQEAFLKVLRAITRGGGPHDGFAAYLMRAVRNEAIDRLRRSREAAVEDLEAFEAEESSATAESVVGGEQLDRDLMHKAFSALPQQWQRILWLTEVDGLAPREVAPQLRRSPNAVAQLSRRAREGLRTAWLQAHVDGALVSPGCQQTAGELGAYERGQLSAARAERTKAHLEDCVRCSVALRDLQALSTRMRGVLLPLVLGSPMLLEELSEVLPHAERQAVTVPAPEVATAGSAAVEAGGAAHGSVWWRATAAGVGVPVVAAGVAVLVGAAGIALVSQRSGIDPDALESSQEMASPDAVGIAPSDADDPVEPAGPTRLPEAVEEDDAPVAEESAPGTGEAADASPALAPTASPGGGAAPARPGPATPAEPSPAVEVPSGEDASPAGEVPSTTEIPSAVEVPPAVGLPPTVETPPTSDSQPAPGSLPGSVGGSPSEAVSGPSGKPGPPVVPDPPLVGGTAPAPPDLPHPPTPPPPPDPPFLGGGTPPWLPEDPALPPEDPALPPEDPALPPEEFVPPPEEPTEESDPVSGDGTPGQDESLAQDGDPAQDEPEGDGEDAAPPVTD